MVSLEPLNQSLGIRDSDLFRHNRYPDGTSSLDANAIGLLHCHIRTVHVLYRFFL